MDWLNFPADLVISGVALLDALPDYIRAMLAASLLVAFLRHFESRIPANEVQFSESFRKASLVALLGIPLFVGLFPNSRMVVFVEELPAGGSPLNLLWLLLLITWAIGAAAALVNLIRHYALACAALRAAPPLEESSPLHGRLEHWQRRLGLSRQILLVATADERCWHLPFTHRLAFPAAATRWSTSVQDVLLIHELCHLKKHHGHWHLLAHIVACCYWPVTWLPDLQRRLNDGYQLATDELAESCYRDQLGYDRALRQLTQRLALIADPTRAAEATTSRGNFITWLRRYLGEIGKLATAQPQLSWNIDTLLSSRENKADRVRVEPYDKVIWFIGQAAFLAILFTGVTLKETPPQIERDYTIDVQLLWMENFHRNLERLENREPAIDEEPDQ